MAVPKKRKGKSKTRARRSITTKINVPNLSVCNNCGASKLSHRVCPQCGFYRNKRVIISKD